MHRAINILLLFSLTALCVSVWAQQKAAGNKMAPKADNKKAHKYILRPGIYFDNSEISSGAFHKKEFDQLLKEGFTSHDSAGNKYRIIGFDFIYAERNLYEDSIGNLEVLTDYMTEYCPGDTITSGISATIYQRIKPGDTLFIDHVQLQPYPGNTLLSANDTSVMAGKGMKCVIVK